MTYTLCTQDSELSQILDLQAKNLRHTQSVEVEADQGFVTVHHNFDLLKEMNTVTSHIIAKDEGKVVGYALAMHKIFRYKIPILAAMFDLLDNLVVEGKKVGDGDYIVMGQVCVDYDYRGKGVFKGIYKKYFDVYKPIHHRVITEIATRNTRSVRAHLNVGFKEIYRYEEPGVEEWVVVMY